MSGRPHPDMPVDWRARPLGPGERPDPFTLRQHLMMAAVQLAAERGKHLTGNEVVLAGMAAAAAIEMVLDELLA